MTTTHNIDASKIGKNETIYKAFLMYLKFIMMALIIITASLVIAVFLGANGIDIWGAAISLIIFSLGWLIVATYILYSGMNGIIMEIDGEQA